MRGEDSALVVGGAQDSKVHRGVLSGRVRVSKDSPGEVVGESEAQFQ